MLALAQALTVPKLRHPEVVHGSVDGVCSKVQTVNALWGVADGAHQLSRPLAGPLDFQLTHGAAPQDIAAGYPSRGNRTLQVTFRLDGRASRPGSAEPATQNSSEICSRPTGWKFGRKPDRDLDDTTAGGFGT
jgi:hypothetical protein